MSSSGPDFRYINGSGRSEVTTLEERKQPNETKERNPIEQAQWQIKNQTEAETANVIYDYSELIKEVTKHNNYKTTNYDAVSYGLKRINDWKNKGEAIGKEMVRILAKDPNPNLEGGRKNLEAQIASTADNLSKTDQSQCIYYRRTPQICPHEIPKYAGTPSEDFVDFKKEFHRAMESNRIAKPD